MTHPSFYITTPIFYPNARLHMGHAYTTTLCDVLARYHRLQGDDTYFLSGADENTQKVVREATKGGVSVREHLDTIVAGFTSLYERMAISNDQFIRTTDQSVHWPGAQEMWRRLVASGDIYKHQYRGLYCVGAESFVTEKDLREGGLCPDHDEFPQVLEEENYFFRLSRYTDVLLEKIRNDELLILPQGRKAEILALLESGLSDVSFSRPSSSVALGIPVPDDPTQTMYVWCDALTNYITALGFGREAHELFDRFWPATVHVIGKDILRFHAAIWPAMLMSAGLPLPRTILVHGMLTSGGRKMSKSLGNVIDPLELIEQYGVDAVRYYLAREVSPFEDGDITREKFDEVYHANLANGLGNLAARIMTMAATHLSSPVALSPTVIPPAYRDAFDAFSVNRAADVVWDMIGALDGFIQETQPFKVVKTDPEKAKADIATAVGRLADIATLLAPFLPTTAQAITDAIKANQKPHTLFPRIG